MDKKYSEYLDSLYNELDLKIKELNSLILNDKPDAEKKNTTDGESDELDSDKKKGKSDDEITSIDINSNKDTFKTNIVDITKTFEEQEAILKSKDIDNKGLQQKAYDKIDKLEKNRFTIDKISDDLNIFKDIYNFEEIEKFEIKKYICELEIKKIKKKNF